VFGSSTFEHVKNDKLQARVERCIRVENVEGVKGIRCGGWSLERLDALLVRISHLIKLEWL